MTNKEKTIKIGAIVLAVFIIANILLLILSLVTGITNVFFGGDNYEEVTNVYEYDDVKEIEIDGIAASITIEEGSKFTVTTINVDKGFKANLKNHTLKIEDSKSWFGLNDGSRKIIITVPNDTVLEELSIDTGAGKFIIDDIKAREFDIDHGAGMLEISNSIFYEADIDGGAGEIKITNSTLNNLDLDSGVGKVEIEANITGKNKISCGVGEVDITILGIEEDYAIRVNKGIGSIKINNQEQANNAVYGNGTTKIEIDGGIGSINVGFE